jgi:tagatose 1,6-diphosphate aldolase GatY/KbaY
MLTHIKNVVAFAKRRKIAVGAFNTYNLESTLAIIQAVAASQSPAIIQISESTIDYAGLETIIEMIRTIDSRENKDIPLAIHLDHGRTFEIVARCLKAGLTSVHLDGSALDYQSNVVLTKQAADLGHRYGAWVQGELGALFGKEGMTKVKVPKDHSLYMTDPAQAAQFVKKTGIDTLAVSVGTMHGNFSGREKIDFSRLAKIKKSVKIPLVLHGGSGVSSREIKRAISSGIRIINIDTDLRVAFTKTLAQTLKKKITFYDPRKILLPAIGAVEREVRAKIKLFRNKA